MAENGTILVVTENLFFLPRIQAAATAAGMTRSLCSGVKAKATAPASENRPIQVERSFARSNIQAIILHLVRDGVAGRH